MLAGNDVAQLPFATWTPVSATDADANTANLHATIQDLYTNASRDEANLYLPRLQIRNLPGAAVIPVRPNILPDYPSGLTNFQRAGGLVLEGASPRSTVFQIQYDGTPTEDYFVIDPSEYDTPNLATEGLYTRLIIEKLGFCITGGGPDVGSAFDTASEITNDDSGAAALWKYAKFIRLIDWSKDHSFRDCWFQDFRTIAYVDPTSAVTADRTYWERCFATGCGTWLELQDVQSQAHNFIDCETNFMRRSTFVLGSGGGQAIHWDKGFLLTDEDITDEDETEPTYYLFDYEAGHQSDIQSGKCSMRDVKIELKGRLHGLLRNVPTTSEGPDVVEDINPEKRVNETIFDNVVVSTTKSGLGNGKTAGRVIVQVGASRRAVFRDCSWIPRDALYCRDSDQDWCKFRLVMNDELVASGGSLARNAMWRPPELIFERCSGNNNFFATNIEFSRTDGTPNQGTGRVIIEDYSPWKQRTYDLALFAVDQWAEDIRYCMGPGKTAMPVNEIIVPAFQGTMQIPGDDPAFLSRIILPPCRVTGAEIRLAAKSGVQISSATCSYGLTSGDGSTLDINTGTAQDPDDAYYYDTRDAGDFESIALVGEIADRILTFNAQQVTGEVQTTTREAEAYIRYRAYRPFWDGSTALGDLSPWREGRAYSQELLDHMRYWYPCDEGADLIVGDNTDGTGYSERQNPYGFDSGTKVLEGGGTTLPSAVSDGTLGRYVWSYAGSGSCRHYYTANTPGEMLLNSTYSVAGWIYPVDSDLNYGVALSFETGTDYLRLGVNSSSTTENFVVQVGYGGSVTKQQVAIPNGLSAWTAFLLTFDGTTYNLYLGSTTAALTFTSGNTATGQVVNVACGGSAGGGQLFTGRVGGWCFCPDHIMSATDYTEMFTNDTPFPRQVGS